MFSKFGMERQTNDSCTTEKEYFIFDLTQTVKKQFNFEFKKRFNF